MTETQRKYNALFQNYRRAIRWLREVVAYQKLFERESWEDDREANEWFQRDANKAFHRAYEDIKQMREQLDKLLLQLDMEKSNDR